MYGPGAFISGRAKDVQPPGAAVISMLKQVNNLFWRLSIGLPSTDEGGGPRTGLVGFSVLTTVAEGVNPFAGLRIEDAEKVAGAKRYDFQVELDEDPDHQDVEIPVVSVTAGDDQHFAVYCADDVADGADGPLDVSPVGGTAEAPSVPSEPVTGP